MSEKIHTLALELALLSNDDLAKLSSVLNDNYSSRADAFIRSIEIDFCEKNYAQLQELSIEKT